VALFGLAVYKKVLDLSKPGFKGSSDPPQNRRIKMLKNYKELKVWQKSYQLCLEIYRITANFPKEAQEKNDPV